MGTTRVYVGSIAYLQGSTVAASWPCPCIPCQSPDNPEDRRICLVVTDDGGAPQHLMHARRSSVRSASA